MRILLDEDVPALAVHLTNRARRRGESGRSRAPPWRIAATARTALANGDPVVHRPRESEPNAQTNAPRREYLPPHQLALGARRVLHRPRPHRHRGGVADVDGAGGPVLRQVVDACALRQHFLTQPSGFLPHH